MNVDDKVDAEFRTAYKRQYLPDKLCTTCHENSAIGGMIEQFVHWGAGPNSYGLYHVCHQEECLKKITGLKPGHGKEYDTGEMRIYIGLPDNPEEVWRKDRALFRPPINRLGEVEELARQLGLMQG